MSCTRISSSTAKRVAAGVLIVSAFSASAQTVCEGSNENTAVLPSTPTADFIDHGDGTVTHKRTGLMWKRCTQGQTWNGATLLCDGSVTAFPWGISLQNAEADTFAGHTDWRVPSYKELTSIIEHRCYNPSINVAIFPNTASDTYRTSTPDIDDASGTISIFFTLAFSDRPAKNVTNRVRLVRGGQ